MKLEVDELVTLNTGETARVLLDNALRSAKPFVEILTDAKGNKLESPVIVNLEEEPLVYVVSKQPV